MEMEFNGKKVGAIGFRMPNGSLARRATEALMRKGVRYFIMVGAGGSLTNKAGIGSLQLIQSASYNGSTIHLDSLPTQLMDIELTLVAECT